MNQRWLSTLAVCVAVGAIYFLLGKLGLSLAYIHSSASIVWPPSGLALAVILLLGYRISPAILIAAFLVNYTNSGHLSSSILIAIGNTLEGVIGTWLANRLAGGRFAFNEAQNIFRFVFFAAIPSTMISASIGVISLEIFALAKVADIGPVWVVWWLGDLVSDITVAPLILIWATSSMPMRASLGPRRIIEAFVLTAAVVAVSHFIFHGPAFGTLYYPIEYLGLPLLLCAAFRFQQRGAITMACIMSAVAIYGTLHDRGPFATTDPSTSLLLLQTFMGIMTITALVVAALVAEQKRVEVHLRASRNEATRASQAKDQFLAVLSHELRTPLTPVLLTASAMERDPAVPESLHDEIRLIRRNVELEARLIDDLLDLTRIARGKLQLNIETADVHELLQRTIEMCCDGSVKVEEHLDARQHFVRADPARLQQVFWNLLTNAQKFTPVGGTIAVRTSNEAGGETIIAQIADTGVGIEAELLPKLFTAFEQGEVSAGAKKTGLGLGLAISKALMTAHQGDLSAASEGRGRGATFTLRLATCASPVTSDKPQQPRDGAGSSDNVGSSGGGGNGHETLNSGLRQTTSSPSTFRIA